MKRLGFGIIGLACFVAFGAFGYAQTGIISTFAGPPFAADGALAAASDVGSSAAAPDGAGGFYVVSSEYNRVYRVTAGGVISIIAGTGIAGFSGDNGPAVSAQLRNPSGVAVDGLGNLYIADRNNFRIRKITALGVISTVAGNGNFGVIGDGGAATAASLTEVSAVAVDGSGNLYIADTSNHRIRKVTAGVMSTIAGFGTPLSVGGYNGDGITATSAQLNLPDGVAVDGSGNVYIADRLNFRVRKITAGVISTVAGTGTSGFSGDTGSATLAQVSDVSGVAVDGSGSLYIADVTNGRVRRVTAGVINTIAGGGTGGDGGPATSALLYNPSGVAVDNLGNVYINDYRRIRKVAGGVITTVAGTIASSFGGFGGDGGPATSAQLAVPQSVAVDGLGNVFIADTSNHRIRKVTPAGAISTVAGSGGTGFGGDNGPATSALLSLPYAVAVDSLGNLYIADSGNARIRKVTGGVISTIAGTGVRGSSGDNGPAAAAQLNWPSGLAVDSSGNLYVADRDEHRVRKISSGVISAVAGSGSGGFGGDGGPATAAQLNNPHGVALDSLGNLYIADRNNNRVRRISAGSNQINTVAGTGSPGFTGDGGLATAAQLNWPAGVIADNYGNVYIAVSNSNRVRKISADGLISTVAGGDYYGDGVSAVTARLNTPSGVALDNLGNLYIADAINHRIRKVTMGLSSVYGPSTQLRGDFDGDGKGDILWQHANGNTALWLMNGSSPTGVTELISSGTGWNVRKLGDFNGDGKSDILWQHTNGNTAMWLMNGLSVSGNAGGIVDPASGWAVKDVGDFNGDGRSDIFWQNVDGSSALWLLNGTNVIGSTGLIGPGTGWSMKRLGDFNGDGKSDILWQHTNMTTVIWLMDGISVTGASGGLVLPTSGWTVRELGDFNGDGKTDIVWQHTDGSSALWLMNGINLTSLGGLVGSGTGWTVNQTGDFNGDGKSDILWRHTDGTAVIWLMNGVSQSGLAGLIGAGTGWSPKRLGDFGGDGKADIAWQHTDGTSVVWLMNGGAPSGMGGLVGAGTGWSPTP